MKRSVRSLAPVVVVVGVLLVGCSVVVPRTDAFSSFLQMKPIEVVPYISPHGRNGAAISRSSRSSSSGGGGLGRRNERKPLERDTTLLLYATNDNSSRSSSKGVYSRPSAAIEKGSGFFIPGLQGPRVRLLFGIVVLVLTTINHIVVVDSSATQSTVATATTTATTTTVAFSEGLAGVFAILLLLQAAIEFGKEEKGYVVTLDTKQQRNVTEATTTTVSSTSSSSASILSQTWSSSYNDLDDSSFKERVQWAAASYIALTPATQMILLDRNDAIVYRLGIKSSAPPNTITSSNHLVEDDDNREKVKEEEGTKAALDALEKSTSGRVSLPLTHPTVTTFLSSTTNDNNDNNNDARCVVLQRITNDTCWIMSSNQLLQAFTKQDLKWLGQLAKYVSQ